MSFSSSKCVILLPSASDICPHYLLKLFLSRSLTTILPNPRDAFLTILSWHWVCLMVLLPEHSLLLLATTLSGLPSVLSLSASPVGFLPQLGPCVRSYLVLS